VGWGLGLGNLLFGETMDSEMKVYIAKIHVYKSPTPLKSRLADVKYI
jgi:hypothetical protein